MGLRRAVEENDENLALIYKARADHWTMTVIERHVLDQAQELAHGELTDFDLLVKDKEVELPALTVGQDELCPRFVLLHCDEP